MEDLLSQLAHLTESQQGLLRDPPWELRARCLEALRAALHSGTNKLVTLAIQGLQKMLRDDRFASPFESDDESLWLTTQLLDVLPPMTSLTEEAQVEIMRVLLNATCQSSWVANNALVVRIVTLCHQLCTLTPAGGPDMVATAAQATACQAVRGFAAMLDEDYESALSEQQDSASRAEEAPPVQVYEDVLPTYRHLCQQIDQHAGKRPASPSGHPASLQFHLSTLLALLSALPVRVQRCAGVLEQTWRQLTPALVRLLGSPTSERVGAVPARRDPPPCVLLILALI
ncbi:brefeldin A-inhibited guanine nucleotide-exchange protein 3-like [Pollicipes pollicipes]|uniref:brefeldin A-inhibited guanine nucleotide-exchange protein 3-like n=1 Tax=Pollicipes pollicipes TaxID=41117 RepID=UPI001884C9AF|nr:brefeldin A-inhibited guanine nucleotide-exchange protein 3-like [Pollicipes pollicipes]